MLIPKTLFLCHGVGYCQEKITIGHSWDLIGRVNKSRFSNHVVNIIVRVSVGMTYE